MNYSKIILWACLAVTGSTLISCGDAATANIGIRDSKPAPTGNVIQFKIDDDLVTSSGWNISRFDMGQGVRMNITSNMHEDKRTISFNINGWTPGRYSLFSGARDAGTAYGDYKPDYNDMLNAFGFEDGEIHIEKIDIEKGLVNASFFGTITNGHEKHFITEGKIINGKLRSGITKY